MAFHVYPDPPTAPLNVGTGGTSALIPIVKLVSAEATPTMYLRVAVDGPPPPGAVPTIRLKADAGDVVDVPTGSTAAILSAPAGTGEQGAVTMDAAAPDGVYRI